MELSSLLLLDDSIAEDIIGTIKSVARALKLKTRITRLVLPTREVCYSIIISAGNIFHGIDINQIDIAIVDNMYKSCFVKFLSKYLKPTSRIICMERKDTSCIHSEPYKIEEVTVENSIEGLAHLIKMIADMFSIKKNTMLKVLKALKRDDTNSLIETYLMVARK